MTAHFARLDSHDIARGARPIGERRPHRAGGPAMAEEFANWGAAVASSAPAIAKPDLPSLAMDFPAAIDLGSLNGTTGFRIDGIDLEDYSGGSVSSAGDVNGDGIDDIIIGAAYGDPGGDYNAGEAYVVFGKTGGFAAGFSLASLDGTNGFRLDGVAPQDFTGLAAVSSAGDINGDGIGDIIIGAYNADHGYSGTGSSYVVFGKNGGLGPSLDLAQLDGSNGFRMVGILAGDNSGRSVAGAGDFNGDGFDDLIIGAHNAHVEPGFHNGVMAGESYIVFGKAGGFDATLQLVDLDDQIDGFLVWGADAEDHSGYSVSGAGDVNGDGFDDVVIGAPNAEPGAAYDTGEVYVLFGRTSGFVEDLRTLDGSNGFRIEGVSAFDTAGTSVSAAGDVNGDGYADIIIGADSADPAGLNSAGKSYIVHGHGGGFAASINLLSFTGSFLDGIDAGDNSGFRVSGAGDVNGDGFDDVIVGAYRADPGGKAEAGEAYVVFGSLSGVPTINFLELDGSNGFRLDGIDAGDKAGRAVSAAGDVNNDGFDDIIVGAPFADGEQGESYVVFGRAPTEAVERIGGEADQVIRGGAFNDTLEGRGGNDTLDGATGNDSLDGGVGNDLIRGGAGRDYMVGSLGLTLGDDTLFGEGGNDTMANGSNIDIMDGGGGIDTFLSDPLGWHGDFVWNMKTGATNRAGELAVNFENVVTSAGSVFADASNDSITGAGAANDIRANGGDDLLLGRGGNDTLAGGTGRDRLKGDAGADDFELASLAKADADKILDFTHNEDRIALDGAVFGLPVGSLAPGRFAIGNAAGDANDRLIYNDATGKLYFDADGNGSQAKVLIVTLAGAPTLNAGDFIVI